MNLAQAHRKARAAFKRREELIEEEEIEGGEINLIPYLDIVTNLMLFLLASISAGVLLGQINTTLPDQGPPAAALKHNDPNKKPEEKSLQLVVMVSKTSINVFSILGLEGSVAQPKIVLPRIASTNPALPNYDYQKLSDTLYEIAKRRWNGKRRGRATYEVVLMADTEIPYGTIVSAMDAIRCHIAPDKIETCALPRFLLDEKGNPLTAKDLPAGKGNFNQPCVSGNMCLVGLACTPTGKPGATGEPTPATCQNYDPDKHALFHDILFSTGFE